jgi:hypothetical protein
LPYCGDVEMCSNLADLWVTPQGPSDGGAALTSGSEPMFGRRLLAPTKPGVFRSVGSASQKPHICISASSEQMSLTGLR